MGADHKSAATPWIGFDDSLVAAGQLVASGMGRTVLPRYFGDADPRLMASNEIDTTVDLWILAHADLARSARVRAFTQFAFDHLRATLAPAAA